MYLIPWLANGFTSRLQSIMELKLISQLSQVRRFLIMSSLLVGYRVLHLLSVFHRLLLPLMLESAEKPRLEQAIMDQLAMERLEPIETKRVLPIS